MTNAQSVRVGCTASHAVVYIQPADSDAAQASVDRQSTFLGRKRWLDDRIEAPSPNAVSDQYRMKERNPYKRESIFRST